MTTNILKLPLEIQLLILDLIEDFHDRVSLLQVCRDWRAAFAERVYSCIKFNFPEKNFVSFFHELQNNERLKKGVRELIIPDLDVFMAVFYSFERPFKQFLKQFTGDFAAELENGLSSGNPFAWIAVALLLFENLRSLELHLFGYEHHFLTWAATAAIKLKKLDKSHPMGKFEKLTIHNDDVKSSLVAQSFAPFFRLPSMRALHLRGVYEELETNGEDEPEDEPEGESEREGSYVLQPGCSSVRHIVLEDCNCPKGMVDFITSCAGLEYFEYQHQTTAVWSEEYYSFRCHAFYTGLSTQKDTLKVLRLNDVGVTRVLDNEALDDDEVEEYQRQAWFGSLAGFKVLQELRIPVRNLLDSQNGREPEHPLEDILPRSIKYICLAKTDLEELTMLEAQLCRLLAVYSEKFPNLVKVEVQLEQMEVFPGEREIILAKKNWGVPQRTEDTFKDIQTICLQNGIEFGFVTGRDYQILINGVVVKDTDDYVGFQDGDEY